MKKMVFLISIIFSLFSCKEEANKYEQIKNNTIAEVVKEQDSVSEKAPNNCYDYLTEIVRSSNFPFGDIDKNKINLLIDEETDDIINAKLFFETEGTGTVGWIEYHIKERKLFNSSANLDQPEELKYNSKFTDLFEKCKGINNIGTDKGKRNDLKDIYEKCNLITLPNKYSYEFISEEKDFTVLPKEFYEDFQIENKNYFKIARLPDYKKMKLNMLLVSDEAGQSELYLFVSDTNFKILDKVLLYDSEDTDKGSLSTTYEISKDYKIKIKKADIVNSGNKTIEKNIVITKYNIDDTGKFKKE